MSSEKGSFPAPYLNSVREEDPIMKRVPMDTLDIGARKSGLPKGGISNNVTINHVGESTPKGGR